MTAHEILTAPRVVLHLPRRCALARKVAVRPDCGHGPRDVRLRCRRWNPLPSKPEFAPHASSHLGDPIPTKVNRRRFKSHR
jgi:hypothetical protein